MKDKLYSCPVCRQALFHVKGNRITDEGTTMFCPHGNCPAQEVEGYGKTPDDAFKIIQQKFPKETAK